MLCNAFGRIRVGKLWVKMQPGADNLILFILNMGICSMVTSLCLSVSSSLTLMCRLTWSGVMECGRAQCVELFSGLVQGFISLNDLTQFPSVFYFYKIGAFWQTAKYQLYIHVIWIRNPCSQIPNFVFFFFHISTCKEWGLFHLNFEHNFEIVWNTRLNCTSNMKFTM